MAKAIHDALSLTKTPAPDSGSPTAASADLGFDQKQVEQILGHSGKVNGGVLQFAVPRSEAIHDSGMVIPPSMGIATALNFQSSGKGKTAVTGDFVLIANEVNPVIKALQQNGIAITAIHSHMLKEEPRLFFMHFWAINNATTLARGLRAAPPNDKHAPTSRASCASSSSQFHRLFPVAWDDRIRRPHRARRTHAAQPC
jgi:hypothetical protein